MYQRINDVGADWIIYVTDVGQNKVRAFDSVCVRDCAAADPASSRRRFVCGVDSFFFVPRFVRRLSFLSFRFVTNFSIFFLESGPSPSDLLPVMTTDNILYLLFVPSPSHAHSTLRRFSTPPTVRDGSRKMYVLPRHTPFFPLSFSFSHKCLSHPRVQIMFFSTCEMPALTKRSP